MIRLSLPLPDGSHRPPRCCNGGLNSGEDGENGKHAHGLRESSFRHKIKDIGSTCFSCM